MRGTAIAIALALGACKKSAPPPVPSDQPSAAVIAPAAAQAGSPLSILDGFEGRIAFVAKGQLAGAEKGGPGTIEVSVLVKDKKVRLDLPPNLAPAKAIGQAFALIEVEKKKIYAVLVDKKQAMLLDLDKAGPQLEAMSKSLPGSPNTGAGGSGPTPTVTKTGKKDQVIGHACEVWEVTHQGVKTELCIKTEPESFLKLPPMPLPPHLAWASELSDGKHLPLRVVVFEKGAESGRIELTAIEKKTLAAADFEVPRGFIIVSLDQAMLGGLSGMGALPGAGASGDPMARLRALQGLRGLSGMPSSRPAGSAPPKAPKAGKTGK